MATRSPKNGLTSLLEHRGRRTTDPEPQKASYDDRYIVHFGIWKIVEAAFIRPRNIIFDRHVFLITKQLRGETVQNFYGKLREVAENCYFENKGNLMRDVFITNLNDPQIHKGLLKQTVDPRQALELAFNLELGMRKQD